MFKSAAMRQVNIFVLEEDVLDVTVALGRLGVLHLAELESDVDWKWAKEGRWQEQANEYSNLKRRLSQLLDTLEISHQDSSAPDSIEFSSDTDRLSEEIEEIEELIGKWKQRHDSIQKRIERLQLIQEETKAICPLDVSVENLRALKHLHFNIGSILKENFQRLQMVLFRIPFVIIPIYEHDGWVLIFAASAKEDAAVLDRSLESALFQHLELPSGITGQCQQALGVVEAKLEKSKRELYLLEQERERIVAENKERLLQRLHQIDFHASVMTTITGFGRHDSTYLITGWVPEEDLDELVETVDESARRKADVQVLEAVAEQREQTPIQLKNPTLLKPFQRILTIFGLPAYDQVDPTPILALTFVLMFGVMFGDLGHGLLLALLGIWLWKRGKDGLAALAPVIIACGISGAVFGLLFGSLFGQEDILPTLWLSPLEDVISLLLTSVAAGVFVLNIGFLLQMINAWRSRDWGGLFFDPNGLAGVVLYWTLLAGGVMIAQGVSIPLIIGGVILFVPIALILLREPLERLIAGERPLVEKGWVTYGVRGFFELFETLLSYFTNSISFVRLGAFAVAHAALGQVVFLMANLSNGIGRWLIILFGTAIIIGFEGVVVGIQALRLEYYEFFNKFFQASGRAFKPFRLATKDGSSVSEQA